LATSLVSLAPAYSGAASGIETLIAQTQWCLSIQREPLSRAVSDLARQLDIQIAQFSDPESASTLVGPVSGCYSRQQALDLALKGSGWMHRFINDRTVAIVPLSAAGPGISQVPQPSSLQAIDESFHCSPTQEPADGHRDAESGGMTQPTRWSRFMHWIRRGSQSGVEAAPDGNPSGRPESQDKSRARGSARTRYGVAVLCAAAPLSALAQSAPQGVATQAEGTETLEEIVVTAERRNFDLQNAPLSMSVRQGSELQEEGRFSVAQILEDVPGVSMQDLTNPGTSAADTPAASIAIRGIKANSPIAALSGVPAVAEYVDDVINGLGGSYDISQVQVLRGPQGTVYGRSATAGVVTIQTANPTLEQVAGNAAVEAGNFGLEHYSAAINLPVGDMFALRVSGNKYEQQGYDAPEGGRLDTLGGRAKLLFKPNANLSVLLGFAAEENTEHSGENAGFISGTGTGDVQFTGAVPVGTSRAQSRQYWAKVDWDLGPATLTYIPALRTFTQNAEAYSVFTPGSLITAPLEIPSDSFHTEELRLTSNSTKPLQWQTGVFYYRNTLADDNAVVVTSPIFPPNGFVLSSPDVHRRTEQLGVFAETTYSFTAATRLTTGVRGDYTKIQTSDTDCNGPAGTPLSCLTLTDQQGLREWHNFTYKVRVEQDVTDHNLVYASLSSAFLPGDVGTATGPTGNLEPSSYEPETLTSLELGSKNRFLENRLQINGDVYYYRYGAFQSAVDVGQLGGPGGPALVRIMGAPARVVGEELEVLFQATTADRFGLNVSHSNAYYVDKPPLFAAGIANATIADIIPWNVDPTYIHTVDLPGGQTLRLKGEALFRSSYLALDLPSTYLATVGPYVTNGNTLQGNFTLSWNWASHISLSAYVRNVSNVRYKLVTEGSVSSPVATSNVATLSEPRTFGAVLSASF